MEDIIDMSEFSFDSDSLRALYARANLPKHSDMPEKFIAILCFLSTTECKWYDLTNLCDKEHIWNESLLSEK
jgi:replication initiation and membrane attachment protein DnaB